MKFSTFMPGKIQLTHVKFMINIKNQLMTSFSSLLRVILSLINTSNIFKITEIKYR